MRAGLLEMADGGTLYFDEVADMPLSTQARILRVLTEQSFVRAGGNRQIRVDVRVVSSTARDLEKEIEEKRFREDLFYRLNVVPVSVPRWPPGATTFPRSPTISSPVTPASRGCRRRKSRPRRSRRCRPTTGRATSASCATWSSAP